MLVSFFQFILGDSAWSLRTVLHTLRNCQSQGLPFRHYPRLTKRLLLNVRQSHLPTRELHGPSRAPPLRMHRVSLASRVRRRRRLPLLWEVVHFRIPSHRGPMSERQPLFSGHMRRMMRSGVISRPEAFPRASRLLQSHYHHLHLPRTLHFPLRILLPPRPPLLQSPFRAQQVPTRHSLTTPSYLRPIFASLLCLHPQRVPLHSNLHQVAKVHQNRPKGIPVPVGLNPLQPVLVSVSGSERDQGRAMVMTTARRRVPPQYALASSGGRMLLQGRRRHHLRRQNLRPSRRPDPHLQEVEHLTRERDHRALLRHLSRR